MFGYRLLDMTIMRQPASTVIVEDRWSTSSGLVPVIDTINNVVYESGGFQNSTGAWDITFSRLGNTLDTLQDRVLLVQIMQLTIALGKLIPPIRLSEKGS